jgi:hypothetical protein
MLKRAVLLGLLLFPAARAGGASVTFDDLTDDVAVTHDGFLEAAAAADGERAVFGGRFATTDGAGSGFGLVVFVEPGTRLVSDVLSVRFLTGTDHTAVAAMEFRSDPAVGDVQLPADFPVVAETGGLQEVESLLVDQSGAAVGTPAGLQIFVASDAEPLPTPRTLWAVPALLAAVAVLRGWRAVPRPTTA